MNKQTGFTLIELLVTIALMGIMATVALPAMNGFMERQRIKSALNSYTNAFVFARNEAIRQNVPVLVCGANISIAGQLVGCANNTKSWSEGVFVYADINGNQAYNSDVDTNIRVVNSPNAGNANVNKVTIAMSISPLTGTSPITNPTLQFLPNGQVKIGNVTNANYVVMNFTAANNSKYSIRALMGPTGQIIRCDKNTKANNTSNKVYNLCTA